MPLGIRESGPLANPTIVFLHGGGVSGWMWQPQVEQLTDYHCLVPDLPEHGRSIAEKPFTIKDTVARVTELVRTRAHDGRAHLVGLSLGAQTAVQLLSTAPEVVDHAIVSGTLVRPIRGAGMLGLIAKMYMPFKDIGFLVWANTKSAGIPAQYLAEVRHDTRLLTADSFAHIMSENARFRIPAGLGGVQVPTLVMVGQKEPRVVHESARDLLAVLPNAQGYVVANLGHPWNLQAPDLFARVVRAWINDKPLPQEALEAIK